MRFYSPTSPRRHSQDFLVNRANLRTCRIAESKVPELGAGEALLRVERFGLTANNVTYAVFGERMSYWDFFPAEEGWGRVPMWGFAEVEESEAKGVERGVRVYGYLPPSSYLVVTPVHAGGGGFVDGSPQRARLPSAYQGYVASEADPFYRAETEDLQMLLRPLFFTSFLIDDQLAEEGLVGRGPIVISSASSKTAIAAAFLLTQREGVELVGLTSGRNVEFVESLGIYGRTATYDAISSLDRAPATFVDIAGDGEVRLAVHSHYGDELVHSMAVGVTHWEEQGGGPVAGMGEAEAEITGEGDADSDTDTQGEGEFSGPSPLPGPSPKFFFAPDRVSKRSRDWGPAELQGRVANAWQPFCEWTGSWLEVVHDEGFEAVERVYLDVLEGRVAPKTANVLSLG
jgi:hypothetical protein